MSDELERNEYCLLHEHHRQCSCYGEQSTAKTARIEELEAQLTNWQAIRNRKALCVEKCGHADYMTIGFEDGSWHCCECWAHELEAALRNVVNTYDETCAFPPTSSQLKLRETVDAARAALALASAKADAEEFDL